MERGAVEWTDAGISEVISPIMDGATGTDAATGRAVRAHDGSARTLADGRSTTFGANGVRWNGRGARAKPSARQSQPVAQ